MLKISRWSCNGLFLKMSIITVAFFNAQISQASPSQKTMAFKGFHIGGNLGYESGFANERFNTTAGGVAVSASDKSSFDGIDGGINLGYTHVFCGTPLALGLEGLANWSNVKSHRKFSAAAGGASANFTTEARLKQSFQLVGRLGYVLWRAMPFLKLGWDNSDWEFHAKGTITPGPIVLDNKRHKRINGIAYGAGIDISLTNHILAGLEYTRVDFKKQTVTLGNGNTRASYEPHANKFAAVLKFIFH